MNFNILYFLVAETKSWMYNPKDMRSVWLSSFIEFTQLVILTRVYLLHVIKVGRKETFILNKSKLNKSETA